MKKLMALILALSLPINSFAAECPAPVKLLEENSPAPCRGYLFSPEKELQVRIFKKEYDLMIQEKNALDEIIKRLEKKNFESEKIVQLEMQKTDLWKTRAEDITLKYVTVEENRGRRDFMFILAGVGLTVLAGWAVGQASGSK